MTPEERQLLTALATRIKAAPNQQKDQEADEFLRQLVQQRPDTAYLLAQTVIMQDFALRNAQAQITDLQRQLDEARRTTAPSSGGSFLSGLFGGVSPPPPPAAPASGQYRAPGPASVPPSSPYTRSAPRPSFTGPSYAGPSYAGAPVLQPAQSSGFLQQAATTAVGIAGGALLFEGIQSLFGPHYGGFIGGGPWVGGSMVGGPWGGAGWVPPESLSETTIVNNNYYGDQQQDLPHDQTAGNQPDPGYDQSGGDQGGYQDVDPGGYQDANFDAGQDLSDGGDFGSGNDDGYI
jgi:uncharacterized protein